MRDYGRKNKGRYRPRRKAAFSSWADGCRVIDNIPYRSRSGMLMGVCKGLANHFHFSVAGARLIMVLLFLFTGFWPVGVIYILAGLFMKLEPAIPLTDEQDTEFYQTYEYSRTTALKRIKRKFENIDRRIQRMEETVISKDFKL